MSVWEGQPKLKWTNYEFIRKVREGERGGGNKRKERESGEGK